MRNLINLTLIAATLFLTTSALSCASLSTVSPPALENRTLRLSPDFAGFEYQYEDPSACDKYVLFVCVHHPMKKDTYDITKPEIRKQLIDMGFVLKVRDKQ